MPRLPHWETMDETMEKTMDETMDRPRLTVNALTVREMNAGGMLF